MNVDTALQTQPEQVTPIVGPGSRRTRLVVPSGPHLDRFPARIPDRRKNLRLFWTMAAGFVGTFLIGDVILSLAPLPAVYGSRNHSLDKLRLFESFSPTPDVLFLGCSYEWTGISPRVVDATLAERFSLPATSFNLSASSASGWTQFLMVRRLLETGRLPKVMYLDVGPIALQSTGRAYLINGLRALGDFRDIPDAATVNAEVLGEAIPTSLFRSYHRWEDVRMIAHSLVIGAPLVPKLKLITDDRGWAEWTGKRTMPGDPDAANLDWVAGAVERVATGVGEWPAERNIHVQGLRRAVERLRTAGVGVRLVEMPVSSVADPRLQTRGNASYEELLAAVVADNSIPVLRVPHGLFNDDDFFDAGHLHPAGAAKFSVWLAGDVAAALNGRPDMHPPSPTLGRAPSTHP